MRRFTRWLKEVRGDGFCGGWAEWLIVGEVFCGIFGMGSRPVRMVKIDGFYCVSYGKRIRRDAVWNLINCSYL